MGKGPVYSVVPNQYLVSQKYLELVMDPVTVAVSKQVWVQKWERNTPLGLVHP